jgi:hypothetical protein
MQTQITRRSALTHLLTLGAGATAALALPVAAQAAPAAPAVPALPDWLTAAPWLAPALERIARAAVTFPDGYGETWLAITADVAEQLADPNPDRSGASVCAVG